MHVFLLINCNYWLFLPHRNAFNIKILENSKIYPQESFRILKKFKESNIIVFENLENH